MRGHVELADGVHQLMVQPGINVVVVRDTDGVTLVDTGLASRGLLPKLAGLGIAPADVTRILLTHGHPDHAGGISRLRAAGSTASIEVGAGDLDIVRGLAPQPASDPSTGGGRLFNRFPPPGPFATPVAHPDATALADGDELPIAGGVRVIATPGHTPGHVAYHLPAHDLLLGGDTLFNVFTLRPAPAMLCWRVPLNRRSVARLADVGAGTLTLAHGRPVTGDVRGRLQQLVADVG